MLSTALGLPLALDGRDCSTPPRKASTLDVPYSPKVLYYPTVLQWGTHFQVKLEPRPKKQLKKSTELTRRKDKPNVTSHVSRDGGWTIPGNSKRDMA